MSAGGPAVGAHKSAEAEKLSPQLYLAPELD